MLGYIATAGIVFTVLLLLCFLNGCWIIGHGYPGMPTEAQIKGLREVAGLEREKQMEAWKKLNPILFWGVDPGTDVGRARMRIRFKLQDKWHDFESFCLHLAAGVIELLP